MLYHPIYFKSIPLVNAVYVLSGVAFRNTWNSNSMLIFYILPLILHVSGERSLNGTTEHKIWQMPLQDRGMLCMCVWVCKHNFIRQMHNNRNNIRSHITSHKHILSNSVDKSVKIHSLVRENKMEWNKIKKEWAKKATRVSILYSIIFMYGASFVVFSFSFLLLCK